MLAPALERAGRSHAAVAELLELVAEAVEQPDVQPYARATRFYAAEPRAGADGGAGTG